jgi:hypothetical protein
MYKISTFIMTIVSLLATNGAFASEVSPAPAKLSPLTLGGTEISIVTTASPDGAFTSPSPLLRDFRKSPVMPARSAAEGFTIVSICKKPDCLGDCPAFKKN